MPSERDIVSVLLQDRHRAEDLIAMGLYQFYKWDRIYHAEEIRNAELTLAEAAGIADGFTNNEFNDLRTDATRLLREYEDAVRQKDKWVIPVFQGFLAALIYSLFLVAMLLVINILASIY
jgi:hypothetical protein